MAPATVEDLAIQVAELRIELREFRINMCDSMKDLDAKTKTMSDSFVSLAEFRPVRIVIYGLVGVMLLTVMESIVRLSLR